MSPSPIIQPAALLVLSKPDLAPMRKVPAAFSTAHQHEGGLHVRVSARHWWSPVLTC